ncbi:MAG: hypothetical protein HQM10_14325 [Candidatus Riflebacteria bacterium]|nr:hypothetical protein [Candidatus Riflebacteria bacterium]
MTEKPVQSGTSSVVMSIIVPDGKLFVSPETSKLGAVVTPEVTFKLILLNTANPASPAEIITHKASVDSTGAASTTFYDIPAVTAIGDIHIEDGRISSFSDFHGAADLQLGTTNILTVMPKGEKGLSDLLAETISTLISNQAYFKTVPQSGLSGRLTGIITPLNSGMNNIYGEITRLWLMNNPIIQVNATSTRAMENTSLTLNASASDNLGSSFTYNWYASTGALSSATGDHVNWQAPTGVATAVIYLGATSNLGVTATSTFIVRVYSSTNNPPSLSIFPGNSIAPAGVQIDLSGIANDPDGDPLTYSWNIGNGATLSSSSSQTTSCIGTAASSSVNISCTVSDGRGGTASASAQISFIDISSIPVGGHFSIQIASPTHVHLPTPTLTEKFGMILYSKNTDDNEYTIDLNGGGMSLRPQKSQFKASSRTLQIIQRKAIDEKIRERRKEILAKRNFFRASNRKLMRSLNDQKNFMLPSDDQSGISTITARLAGAGTFCEIFLDNAIATDSETASAVPDIVNSFDSEIFPFITNNYMSQADYFAYGDINLDHKITILISPMIGNIGAMGIFHPKDFSTDWDSNHEDMFYVDSKSESMDYPTWKDEIVLTIVHEYQHLVNFIAHTKLNSGIDEEAWLNEGLSVQAEVRFSGKTSAFFNDYAIMPESDGLIVWNDQLSDYGSSGLFVHYLFEQLGSATIKSLVKSNAAGIDNVNLNSPSRNFWQLFEDWGISMFRLEKGLPANPLYDYTLDLGLDLWNSSKAYSNNYSATMRGNAFRFIELSSALSQVSRLLLSDKSGNGQFKAVFIRFQ